MKKSLLVLLLVGSVSVAGFGPASSANERRAKRPVKKVEEPTAPESIPDLDSCGLGWQVTQKQTLSAVTTRGTTNAVVPPTFGMTSGTIGCKQMPLSKNDEQALKYAYNNFDTLSVEMAEGQGEFLQAFAQSLGCADSVYPQFSRLMQDHYRSIMKDGSANSFQMFNQVKSELKQDTVLAIGCNAV